MGDDGWNGAAISELVRELRGIREALEEHNEILHAVIENISDGSEERPVHVKWVSEDTVLLEAYREGSDERPLPTIEHEHSFTETDPDSRCDRLGCDLRYADWTATR